MRIDKVTVGLLQTNCYIVSDDNKKAAVIDPGDEPQKILSFLEENGLSCEYILLTHGHFDHIGGVASVKEKTGARVAINKNDAEMIKFSAETLCGDGDKIKVGDMEFKVIETPGHTRGCVCYICGDKLFSGDTLFCDSVGRTDLPGGDFGTILESLKKLRALEGEYEVFPGHGESTTLSCEKAGNRFMRL